MLILPSASQTKLNNPHSWEENSVIIFHVIVCYQCFLSIVSSFKAYFVIDIYLEEKVMANGPQSVTVNDIHEIHQQKTSIRHYMGLSENVCHFIISIYVMGLPVLLTFVIQMLLMLLRCLVMR